MLNKTLKKNISFIFSALSKKRQRSFRYLAVLMVISAGAELLSVGAVIPFLAVLTDPEIVLKSEILAAVFSSAGFLNSRDILLPVTMAFIFAVILSSIFRLLMNWYLIRTSYSAGRDLSIKLFDRVLHQEYEKLIERNSSEIVSALSNKTTMVVVQAIVPTLQIISGVVTLLAVFIFLVTLSPATSFYIFLTIGMFYLFVIFVTKTKLQRDSNAIAKNTIRIVKVVNEALGDIRDLFMSNNFSRTINDYSIVEKNLRLAQGDSKFISESPRYVIEAFGIGLIALLAFIFSSEAQEGVSIIPFLGALALSAQRMLPIAQGVFNGWAQIKQGSESLSDVVELLQLPISLDTMPYSHEKTINLKDVFEIREVDFAYPSSRNNIIKNANITVDSGSTIGFMGETGSGKSTFIDILMGLLIPQRGDLFIDGVKLSHANRAYWRQSIAHVSQDIFLPDDTALSIITSNERIDLIDYDRVAAVCDICQLTSVIDSWEKGMSTNLGERGVSVSGGQRQRVAIARALYKGAKVLVLDEATSALDVETEKSLIRALRIHQGDVTIIMIAHRLETLVNCDRIFKLSNGILKECDIELIQKD